VLKGHINLLTNQPTGYMCDDLHWLILHVHVHSFWPVWLGPHRWKCHKTLHVVCTVQLFVCEDQMMLIPRRWAHSVMVWICRGCWKMPSLWSTSQSSLFTTFDMTSIHSWQILIRIQASRYVCVSARVLSHIFVSY